MRGVVDGGAIVTEDSFSVPLDAEMTEQVMGEDSRSTKTMEERVMVLPVDGATMMNAEGVGVAVSAPTSLDADVVPFTPVMVKSRVDATFTLPLSAECCPHDVFITIFVYNVGWYRHISVWMAGVAVLYDEVCIRDYQCANYIVYEDCDEDIVWTALSREWECEY